MDINNLFQILTKEDFYSYTDNYKTGNKITFEKCSIDINFNVELCNLVDKGISMLEFKRCNINLESYSNGIYCSLSIIFTECKIDSFTLNNFNTSGVIGIINSKISILSLSLIKSESFFNIVNSTFCDDKVSFHQCKFSIFNFKNVKQDFYYKKSNSGTAQQHDFFFNCEMKRIEIIDVDMPFDLNWTSSEIGYGLINNFRIQKLTFVYVNIIHGIKFINNHNLNNIILRSCEINDYVDFENGSINNFIFFNSTIKSTGYIRILNTSINDLRFIQVINEGFILFQNNCLPTSKEKENTTPTIKKITFENMVNKGNIDTENTRFVEIENRNTARILKDSAYKTNNIINALKFKKKEMELYYKEKPNFPTRFILRFNKWSNDYGSSWLRGVGFTLLWTLIFFFPINIFGLTNQYESYMSGSQFSWDAVGELWKRFLDVLNVLNFREKLNGVELNAFGETLFFLSKIFISYGIYQTVSAFRKYGK